MSWIGVTRDELELLGAVIAVLALVALAAKLLA